MKRRKVETSERRNETERVLERCRELGFALAGVCEARATDYEGELRDWLAAGKHGEMTYLARNVDVMVDPRRLVPGARSIICVADRYDGRNPDSRKAGKLEGRIAAYALGDDYHVVMKKRLRVLADELAAEFPGEQFRVCVDTAPLLEREHAQRAGLGAVGKHTLLIEPGVGSYLLLGEIVTTLALEPSDAHQPDPCGMCTRCIDACPTQAISPWSVDATRCISYLTIEHRSEVDPEYHEAMGGWIFGCDICQEVCPHNQPTRRTSEAEVFPAYQAREREFDLLELLNWTEADRREAFTKSAMKRAKMAMMKRNALIAAGNRPEARDDGSLRARIAAIAVDEAEDAMVRATAKAVLLRLTTGDTDTAARRGR